MIVSDIYLIIDMSQVHIVKALQVFFANMHGMCQQLAHVFGEGEGDDQGESSQASMASMASSQKSARSQRAKKVKDPLAPKKPVSAFLFYFKLTREEVKSAHAGMVVVCSGLDLSGHEITRQVARNWNELGKEQREEYEEMAAEDKKRYETESRLYAQKAGECEKAPQKKVKM